MSSLSDGDAPDVEDSKNIRVAGHDFGHVILVMSQQSLVDGAFGR